MKYHTLPQAKLRLDWGILTQSISAMLFALFPVFSFHSSLTELSLTPTKMLNKSLKREKREMQRKVRLSISFATIVNHRYL